MAYQFKRNAGGDPKKEVSKGVMESRWFTLYFYSDTGKYRMFLTYEFGGIEHFVSSKEVEFDARLRFKRLVVVTGRGTAHQIPRTYLSWTGSECVPSDLFNGERFTLGDWTHQGTVFKGVRTVAIVSRSDDHPDLSTLGFVPLASMGRRKMDGKESSKKGDVPAAKKNVSGSERVKKPMVSGAHDDGSKANGDHNDISKKIADSKGTSSIQEKVSEASVSEAEKSKKVKKAAKRAERRKKQSASKAKGKENENEDQTPPEPDLPEVEKKLDDGDSDSQSDSGAKNPSLYMRVVRIVPPLAIEGSDVLTETRIRADDFLRTWQDSQPIPVGSLYGVYSDDRVVYLSRRVTVSIALTDGTNRIIAIE